MVSAAVIAAAAVAAAGVVCIMVVIMAVVVALNIGIEYQLIVDQCFCSSICAAGNTAVQLDSGCCQCHLGTAANTAANQGIGIQGSEHTGQCTVTAAEGIHHLGRNNLAFCNIIDLKLTGMTKMLEDHTVFIGNCNSHLIFFFRIFSR